jgi:hypothetical protein
MNAESMASTMAETVEMQKDETGTIDESCVYG